MNEAKSTSRGSGRTILSIFLIAVIASAITLVTTRIIAQGKRIAVQVETELGTIQLADGPREPRAITWICDPENRAVVTLDEIRLQERHWELAVTTLIPGARLERLRSTTHTMQASTAQNSGDVLRRVQGVRAQLEITTAAGTVEPALGIAASIEADGARLARSYLSIVRVRDASGAALAVDGDPLFNPKEVPLLDRARGLPAHGVRFELEEWEPPAESSEEEDAEARRAIERLKQNRPERGVLPDAPGGGSTRPPGSGETGTGN